MSETEKSKPNKESSGSSNAPSTPPATTTKSSSSSITATTTTSSVSSSSAASTSGSNKLPSKPPPPLPPPPPPPPKLLPPPAPVSKPKLLQHVTEASIKKAFSDYVKDPESLDKAANYLYESIVDDAVMGTYLEVHRLIKTGALEAIEGEPEDETTYAEDSPNYDVFGMSTIQKAMNCNCPNCDKLLDASKFAPHLAKCMGLGRKTTRTTSRRLANAKEGNPSYFPSNVSDDEEFSDWSSEKRRKKIQSSRTNGSKKNGKSKTTPPFT